MRRCRFGASLSKVGQAIASHSHRHVSSGHVHNGGSRAATMSFGIDPAKLDLGLDLDKMDFGKIAQATHQAMAQERTASRVRKDETKSLDAAAAAAADMGVRAKAGEGSQGEDAAAGRTSPSAFGHGGRTIRGIVGAGDVHDSQSPSSAYAQRRREAEGGLHGSVRYTLMDTLRDASMSGNWLKAFKMFENAVQKACSMIVAPVSSDSTVAAEGVHGATDPVHEAVTSHHVREKEVFEALAKINAALPPRGSGHFDRSSDVARRRGMSNMAGVMRWHGGHFNLLLKTLLAAERVDEAERVWAVMKGIGFVQYQMDERTVNSLVGLLRHSRQMEDATQQLVTPIVASHRIAEQLEREKAFKRQMIIELEAVARERQLRLRGANGRTATVARIAEAMQAQSDGTASDVQQEQHSSSSSPSLRVGDFNGLLRISQSHEGTRRVLAMMDKLGIDRDATTYASIIAAHKNPSYRVEGATDADVVPTVSGGEERDQHEADSSRSDAMVGQGAEDGNGATEETKSSYEAYKDRRIASAKRWFHACPADARSANLYNEMLYLLRANRHQVEFDSLLTEYRGNALRSAQEWSVVERVNTARVEQRQADRQRRAEGQTQLAQTATTDEVKTAMDALPAVPAITPPSWRVAPNGRTYELLIQRCRYRHDWEGMWELFHEMRSRNTPGTAKLYQLLLADAKSHPPLTVGKHGDVSAFIMELYGEMRRNKVDVVSIGTTLSLVNAWSATKSKRRWS